MQIDLDETVRHRTFLLLHSLHANFALGRITLLLLLLSRLQLSVISSSTGASADFSGESCL